MAKIALLPGTASTPPSVLGRAMEDMEDYDQVVVLFSGPEECDFRWSNMSMKDLVYLHRAFGARIDELINGKA